MHAALITSHSQNNKTVFDLTTDNHREYCQRRSYDYIPNDEPYSPHMPTKYLLSILTGYDFIATMGVDLWIQHPEKPLEDFLRQGITLCPEFSGGTLNADFIVYKNCPETIAVLEKVSLVQQSKKDGQQALNQLYKDGFPGIYSEKYMQIAAPVMNPCKSYKGFNTEDYFTLHFHTLGSAPYVFRKEEGLKRFLHV
jgi:hypothetical protein